MTWQDEPIFVTGATGFIGGRLCERLVLAGARRVRALVHDLRHAPRIARLPVELAAGDLLSRSSLRAALGDAKIVIHLGLGHGRGIPKATRFLLDAVEDAHVSRLIHISTTAVHGLKPRHGTETEDSPPRFSGNIYCDNKLRAERAVWRRAQAGLPAVILRPSIVYGPYSRWCTGLIEQLKMGSAVTIDGGQGICNTTHVDNLVDAIFLALSSDRALHEVFYITDGERVTWRDFIIAHAEMLHPIPPIGDVSSASVIAFHRDRPGLWRASWQKSRETIVSPEFRRLLKTIPVFDAALQRLWYQMQTFSEDRKEMIRARLSGRASTEERHQMVFMPDLETCSIQTVDVQFSISKAMQMLAYRPILSFAHGISLTEQWLRWANYL